LSRLIGDAKRIKSPLTLWERLAMTELRDDLLWGADAIAAEIFGDEKHRDKVYRLRTWPLFRVGAINCGRRSSIRKHIENLEKEAAAEHEGAR
jgi:hypothetical protein